MVEMYPWLSVVPPLVAIGLAIKYRQVYLALIIGLWSGATILANGNVLKGCADTINLMVNVFKDENNTRVILFSALIGALLAFMQRSGGVQGFINFISNRDLISTRRRAQLMAAFIGMLIPIESSINVLVTGTVSRPIFDKLKLSREKLAYICDSISAPVCSIIPINAWGAYIATLLIQQNVDSAYKIYLQSIPFNFYSLFAVGMVLFVSISQKDFFSMKRAERRALTEGKVLRDGATPLVSSEVILIVPKEGIILKAYFMIIPILTMVIMMMAGMLITGKGHLTEGSGSTSVLWAVISAIAVSGIMCRVSGIIHFNEIVEYFFKGIGGLIPIAILMVFAFAIGKLCRDLNTGAYVAGITSRIISPKAIPLILFLTSCFIAFSTGTSWGTWAIMFPIGIGIAHSLNLEILPVVGAMVSGGVFGDHCSPISDTTIVSSMASASDHIDHVNTQLPYALTAAGFASVFFIITGIIMY